MKAGSPTARKMRPIPAWITPAVWVPGGRQGAAADSASDATGQGSGMRDTVKQADRLAAIRLH